MTVYALGLLMMLAFMTLLIIASVMILMMESLALEETFIADTLRDTTMLSLAPVSVPPAKDGAVNEA